jgi:non-ribosomal peptide synthetase component F
MAELRISSLESRSETTLFDLMLDLTYRDNEIVGCFRYNSELFEPGTIEQMAKRFEKFMQDAARNPGKKLTEIEMMTEQEQEGMISGFNNDLELMLDF